MPVCGFLGFDHVFCLVCKTDRSGASVRKTIFIFDACRAVINNHTCVHCRHEVAIGLVVRSWMDDSLVASYKLWKVSGQCANLALKMAPQKQRLQYQDVNYDCSLEVMQEMMYSEWVDEIRFRGSVQRSTPCKYVKNKSINLIDRCILARRLWASIIM